MTSDQRTTDVSPERPTSHWLRALPVVVLLIAIGAQAALMATVNADRQSGSGFAMFSSVDFAGSRTVVVEASSDATTVQVQVPSALRAEIDDLLLSPTNDEATDIAARLITQQWNIGEGNAEPDGDAELETVTVTVRGLTANGRQLQANILAHGSASS